MRTTMARAREALAASLGRGFHSHSGKNNMDYVSSIPALEVRLLASSP